MDKEIKREARKQFFHYFRIWFIVVGILALLCVGVGVMRTAVSGALRGNSSSPEGRVFDFADVLSDSEEKELEEYIARCEDRYHFDIVVVTICEDVESYGYWDRVMERYADDFYDEGGFGYNKLHGDGILILDNWYEGQAGTWLSTAGRVYEKFSYSDIDRVLDAIDNRVKTDPYAAYKAGINKACRSMSSAVIPWAIVLFVPILVAVIYAVARLHQSPAQDTTSATTYVAGGRPVMREQRDDFIRKSVVTTRIQSSSGGGGGGGRAGGHVSSGGVHHGGGGRRR